MVQAQEIIERTFYISLLNTALKLGVTLNPDDYLPLSEANQDRFHRDMDKLTKFIPIFGIGTNHVRGAKTCPRITLDLQGYYPGDVGVPAFDIEGNDTGDNYQAVEYPWNTKDITIDVHLIANNQNDMRLLHTLMYHALPAKGYLRPYFGNFEEWRRLKLGPTGNLYLEVGNYYDKNNTDHGILEKVYSYICKDGILDNQDIPDPSDPDKPWIITPIRDISVLLYPESENPNITEVKIS